MCGICGFANFTSEADERHIYPMMDSLTHRGPDDKGVFKDQNVVLGHRRLSIIDPAGGHQPIFNEDKTVAVVQNGEFYNFPQQRTQLQQNGHTFYTKSDAEILVHLYEDHGPDAIKKVQGMFGVALFDTKTQTLWLCRDRLGQKPLYYTLSANGIVFASELKSLVCHPEVSPKLNQNALKKYFFYDYIPGEDTIYENVYKLPAAHFLTVNLKSREVQKVCYWDIPHLNRNSPHTFDTSRGLLAKMLREAVEKRLRADVPTGVLLSGGLDSSIIAQLAADLQPGKKIKTFSIGYDENSYDETYYSALMAKHLDSDHHHYNLSDETAAEILQQVKLYIDEPFADPSIIPTFYLAQNTRKHVKVVLGGDGSDELFAGYQAFNLMKPFWRLHFLRHTIQHLIPLVSALLPTKDNYASAAYAVNRFKESLFIDNVTIQMTSLFGSFSLNEIATLTNTPVDDFQDQLFSEINGYIDSRSGEDYFSQLQYCLAKLYLGDGVLTKVDRASMANSLEVRSPFLDHDLFQDVFEHFPSQFMMKNFKGKYILKETFKDQLPSEIVNRPKKGFAMPLARWIKSSFKDEVMTMLNPKRISAQGILNENYVARIVDEHLTGKMDHRKKIWSLLMMQIWMDNT